MFACTLATTLVSGCGSDDDPGPGGVTVGEAKTLDEAAEMLDAQRLPQEAVAAPSSEPTADENASDNR
ncbi:hypothetical protein KK137_14100 [Croceibacterium sp. LX-88]|uniref:Secreted protein n=1 Tax=Croceibacterium selenioxidans TaxID=2838833 RepID=A0ABS5W7J6_9SPHN|nr:hypothetical protein [Croceibacterium selenioxidans]MBT2135466.1 hypothetical protein [Croceibacterium selenioxidans]